MNGHPTPRRASAGPHLLTSGRHRLSHLVPAVLLLAALLGALLGATLLVTGCGWGEVALETSTTVLAMTTSTTAPALAEGTFPATVTDDNKNTVTIDAKPMRIVSTAPANTEMLFALGLGDRVVGVNSLDDYPPEVADIAKVGDFQVNTEAVMALSPDLVVGYSGNEEGLAPVQTAGCPVLIFNPTSIEGIYADITALGAATGATGKAAELIESIKAQIAAVTQAATPSDSQPSVFYALDNTLWTCGPGSFVDELLQAIHVLNVAAPKDATGPAAQAYYQFSAEQLVAADPDVVLLPGSMYKNPEEFTADPRFAGLTAVKEGHVYVIDDVIVTRPGPRIGQGLKILFGAIYGVAD